MVDWVQQSEDYNYLENGQLGITEFPGTSRKPGVFKCVQARNLSESMKAGRQTLKLSKSTQIVFELSNLRLDSAHCDLISNLNFKDFKVVIADQDQL